MRRGGSGDCRLRLGSADHSTACLPLPALPLPSLVIRPLSLLLLVVAAVTAERKLVGGGVRPGDVRGAAVGDAVADPLPPRDTTRRMLMVVAAVVGVELPAAAAATASVSAAGVGVTALRLPGCCCSG